MNCKSFSVMRRLPVVALIGTAMSACAVCAALMLQLHASEAFAQVDSRRPTVAVSMDNAAAPLQSRFASTLDETAPLPEYPRPQLQRPRWRSLNGWWEWQELRGPKPVGEPLEGHARVPFAVESQMSGLGFGGALGGSSRSRYRRSFVLPAEWGWPERCTVRLHFGAIDWAALVYVNGHRTAIHTGGFTPFSVDIDAALRARGRRGVATMVNSSSSPTNSSSAISTSLGAPPSMHHIYMHAVAAAVAAV